MFKQSTICLGLACGAALSMPQAGAQTMTTVRVAAGLSLPLYVTAPTGDFNRAFIVEQRSGTTGRIRILDLTTNPPTLLATPYLSISPVATSDEQGLLGLAFHPDFLNNGYFWVNYTQSGGATVIRRYRANAPYASSTTADAASGLTLMTVTQPFTNHNGGWIDFGPDGYMYIGMGDGGSANDPSGNGQNINTLLGKMLRIDVDGPDNIPGNADDDEFPADATKNYAIPPTNPFVGVGGLDEIWAIGLRNPWRASFDRSTGDLYIADVGQNAVEEIDFQPATAAGGRNYGWRCMEGNNCTGLTGCTCNSASLTNPIHAYTHGSGCSVTGGYVYRGSAISGLQGTYFFADYCTASIWSFVYAGTNNPPVTNRTAQLAPGGGLTINSITSFGQDAAGELYITDRGGEVFKITPGVPINDNCANATNVIGGSVAFNSAAATTDGPDETGCSFTGNTQIGADIWYKFVAGCTGTATVGVCGANFNTRLAAYGSCPTGPGSVLACNDDFCGTASQISFAVNSGTVYRIRVGGVNNATGTGTLTITCTTPPACPADISGDNVVGLNDLLAVINSWGPCGSPCPADITGDNVVGLNDLLMVINNWGDCPSGFNGGGSAGFSGSGAKTPTSK